MSTQTESNSGLAAVILAAGKSTRMKSALPKPLHPVCGIPMSLHVVNACSDAGVGRCVVVVGHDAEAVKAGLGDRLEYSLQEQQKGTGHAVKAAEACFNGASGSILVLAGDIPLIAANTLERLIARHMETGAAATLLTSYMEDATGYGRIVRNQEGSIARIVEQKDCTEDEKAIREWNPSIYCFQSRPLFEALARLEPNNAQGELYLTDVIGIFADGGKRIESESAMDSSELLGVNTRVELAEVNRLMRKRILDGHMLAGVTIVDPSATYIDATVQIGQDTIVEPQTFLHGATRIGENCVIGPFTRIIDSSIGADCKVLSSQVVECEIENGVKIGPFANLRPGCRIASGVKIGDFVELKNAALGEKVSASHLSYIGDAEVGAGTNIGAGTVTCNYDGKRKHRTKIGRNVFVGTHSTLIAPVEIGDGAYIAGGSPITEDVPVDALALARSRQVTKPGWAKAKRDREAKNG
jgi:bifunctional UDP-N-acetylglucosamine pyrophosphorylase/glucosamine-1-phosphate N-acetyltransferase